MSRPLRVLQLLPRGGEGGAQLTAMELAAGLRARGIDVVVGAGPGTPPRWPRPVFELPRVERSVSEVLVAAVAVRRLLRRTEPDVVHSHGIGLGLALSLASRRGRSVGSLVTSHGLPPSDVPDAARALRVAGLAVVTVGPASTDALCRAGARVAATIENPIGPAPPPFDRAALGRELGFDPGRPLIVQVGRLVAQKDPLALVRALAHLPDVVALFVGGGPLEQSLWAEARRVGVVERVRLTGWRDDARALLATADAVVVPSRWEGLSRMVGEAWLAGVPLVVASGGAFAGAVTDGVDALTVDTTDPQAFAAAVRRVLTDPTLAAALVRGGRTGAARFSPERSIERHLALYRHVAVGRARD